MNFLQRLTLTVKKIDILVKHSFIFILQLSFCFVNFSRPKHFHRPCKRPKFPQLGTTDGVF